MKHFHLLLVLGLGCGGGTSQSNTTSPTETSTLSGPLAFQPNSALVIEAKLANGPVISQMADIALVESTPQFDCQLVDAGPPTDGLAFGDVTIQLGQTGGIDAGTFNVTNYSTFSNSPFFTPLAYFRVSAPTSTLAESFSGTLTMTKVGTEWAGNFDIMLLSTTDGGQSSLSGSFDTTEVCVEQVSL